MKASAAARAASTRTGAHQAEKPGPRDILTRFRIIYGTNQRHYRRVELACGIGGAQLWALHEIAGRPGLTVRELTAVLVVHQSTASNLVERIEKSGLITKRKTATDRRRVHLFATARGLRLLRRAPDPAIGVLPDALQRLAPSELRKLGAALDKLIGSMRIKDLRAGATPLASF